jgi:hypothetical protein
MYNQLPSTILKDANTFDLMVADVYSTWEKHKMDPSDTDQYDQNQLMEFMKDIRGE